MTRLTATLPRKNEVFLQCKRLQRGVPPTLATLRTHHRSAGGNLTIEVRKGTINISLRRGYCDGVAGRHNWTQRISSTFRKMGGVHPITDSDAESSTDILVIDDSTGNDSGTASKTGNDTGTASSTDDCCFESVMNQYRLRYRLRCIVSGTQTDTD